MSGDEIPAAQPEPPMDFEVDEDLPAHAEAQETSFAVKELQSQPFFIYTCIPNMIRVQST